VVLHHNSPPAEGLGEALKKMRQMNKNPTGTVTARARSDPSLIDREYELQSYELHELMRITRIRITLPAPICRGMGASLRTKRSNPILERIAFPACSDPSGRNRDRLCLAIMGQHRDGMTMGRWDDTPGGRDGPQGRGLPGGVRMEEEKGRVEWVPKRVRHDEEKGNEQREEEESGGNVGREGFHLFWKDGIHNAERE